jgi:uncharacterized protein (DUF952 family)
MLGHMLRWEKPTHGELTGLFPHVYGALEASFIKGEGRFIADGNGNVTGIAFDRFTNN